MDQKRLDEIKKLYEDAKKDFPQDGDKIKTRDLEDEEWSIDDLSNEDEFFDEYEDELEDLNNEECKKLIKNYFENNIYAIQGFDDDGVSIGMFTNWEIIK